MPERAPLRILTVGSMYPPHYLGGYELVWQAAVRALRAAGHEVRVVATGTRVDRSETRAPAADQDPGVHRQLAWYWRDHAFPRLGLRERVALEQHNHRVLRRHLDDLRPDLVSWWHMGGMSLSLIEAVRRRGIPAVGWVNDDWLIYGPEVDAWGRAARRAGPLAPAIERLAGAPARVDLDRAARWIFCSQATRTATLRHRPGLVDTAVRHPGVGPGFAAAPARDRWDGRLLYVGRTDPRKGIATLLKAVAHLPGVTLRVVADGDPEELERLRRRADAGQVTFEPGVARAALPVAYAAADAVIFPVEWSEPFGLVPLEAMAVGRPVVATGLGGSAEYLEHESNALLFRAGDPEALAAAVRRLAGDPELRARLRAGGLATAARLTEAAWTAAVVAEHEAAAADRVSPGGR